MRPIDADEVFKDKVITVPRNDVENAIKQMRKLVDNAPTLDAVPVVRCKDCIYYDDGYCIEQLGMSANEDAFCSWGERRK